LKRQKQKSEEKIKVTAEIVIEIKEEVTQNTQLELYFKQ